MSIIGEVYNAFYERQRNIQLQDISGIGHYHSDPMEYHECNDDECFGLDPLITVKGEIEGASELLGRLALHKHQFEHNGICWCGWDGNA